MDEIPSAKAKAQAPPPPKVLTLEELQVKQCVEATKRICERVPSVTLTFDIPLQEDLLAKLIEKGFRVRYTLDYDSGESASNITTVTCKVTISNPVLVAKKDQQDTDATVKFLAHFMDRMAENSGEKAAYGMLSSFLGGGDIFTSSGL